MSVGFKNQDPAYSKCPIGLCGQYRDGDNDTFPGGIRRKLPLPTLIGKLSPLPSHTRKFANDATGVFTYWSFNRLKSITDGLSKTYCVGEKYMKFDSYENQYRRRWR